MAIPPRFAELILSILADPEDKRFLIADLDEEFKYIASLRGDTAAVRWYWLQMFRSIFPCLCQRVRRATRRDHQSIGQTPGGNNSMQRWGRNFVGTVISDIRYGLRVLLKNPVFTAVALLSLALGIGANTAIFSMIDVMMLKSMPVKDPQQLALFTVARSDFDPNISLTYPLVEKFQADKNVFSGVFASAGPTRAHMTVSGGGNQSELVRPERVTGNFFDVLGINPAVGRIFTEEDDRPFDAHAVAVLNYGFWKRRFGLDPNIIGKNITLDDQPFRIIGVAPPGFNGMEVGGNPDMWYPLGMEDQTAEVLADHSKSMHSEMDSWWLRTIGRLKPGVNQAQAQAEMNVIFQQMLNDIAQTRSGRWTPTDKSKFFARKLQLQSGSAGFSYLRFRFAKPLYILMVTVGLVLLIACANVANLLLARAASRQKEIAVRLSIGASRSRLIQQLLTESILLSAIGGVLGLGVSSLFTGLLVRYVLSGQTQLALDMTPNTHILVFTLAVSLMTGLLFGLAPALRATGFDLVPALKEANGNLRVGMTRIAIDKLLVITQVALSLFLLIGAGLFVRTLQNLKSIDAGFEAENLLVFDVDTKTNYTADQRKALVRQLLPRLESLPGTRSASVTQFTFLSGNSSGNNVSIPGYTPSPDDNMACHVLNVGPRFFETMGVPVLAGRDFDKKDDNNPADVKPDANQANQPAAPGGPKPVIINQTMADFFFKNDNPLGKHFTSNQNDYEIIGVVKDAKYENLREKPDRAFYTPYFLSRQGGRTMLLRTFNNPTAVASSIQQMVHELDKDAQILNVRTMEGVVDNSVVQERFIAQLASFFSLFALLLACIGLYGIMSYGVVRRTKEMGIRMALGAKSGNVVWLVMRQSLLLVVIGVAIAIPSAMATTRLVSSYLFGLSATDPITVIGATLVLLTIAALAGYLPARRASRIDPMIALRYE